MDMDTVLVTVTTTVRAAMGIPGRTTATTAMQGRTITAEDATGVRVLC